MFSDVPARLAVPHEQELAETGELPELADFDAEQRPERRGEVDLEHGAARRDVAAVVARHLRLCLRVVDHVHRRSLRAATGTASRLLDPSGAMQSQRSAPSL